MEGKDNIKELFSRKLGNYEAKVSPELWGKVASQIGAGASAGTAGMSMLSKWMIGLGLTGAAVTTATILIVNSSNTVSTEVDTNENVKTIVEEEFVAETVQTAVAENGILEINMIEKGAVVVEPEESNDVIVEVSEVIDEVIEVDIPPIENVDKVADSDDSTNETINSKTNTDIEVKNVKSDEEGSIGEVEDNTENKDEKSYRIAQYPNIFTPNNDGRNDVFFLDVEGIQQFSIVILDRNMKTVYQSDKPDFSWDGLDQAGNKANDGSYIYMITGYDEKMNPVSEYKNLTLKR